MLLLTLLLIFCNFTILNNTIIKSFLLLKLLKCIYNKTLLLLFLNRTTRSFKTTNCSNYKNLNCCNKSKNYTHIIRILWVLFINNNLNLSSIKVLKILNLSITKSQFYKKTC